MGWGRMMLLGNIGQQLDIEDVGRAVGELQDALRQTDALDQRQEQSLDDLKKENHELKLYLATLVKLLVAKGVIRQDEVGAAVQAVEKT